MMLLLSNLRVEAADWDTCTVGLFGGAGRGICIESALI